MSTRLAGSYVPGLENGLYGSSLIKIASWKPKVWPLKKLPEKLLDVDAFERSYREWDPSSISCWLRTENLVESLSKCLHAYEEERKYAVDWGTFEQLVNKSSSANPTNHKPCSDFFDDDTKRYVQEEIDHLTFEKFGYTQCCEH